MRTIGGSCCGAASAVAGKLWQAGIAHAFTYFYKKVSKNLIGSVRVSESSMMGRISVLGGEGGHKMVMVGVENLSGMI